MGMLFLYALKALKRISLQVQQYCREVRVWAEQLKKQLQNNVHSTVDQFASTFCRQIESKVVRLDFVFLRLI